MNIEAVSKLMNAIPFSEKELELIKKGEISDFQRARLKAKSRSNFLKIVLYSILCYVGIPIVFGFNFITISILIIVLLGIGICFLDVSGKIKNGDGIKIAEGEVDFNIDAIDENGRETKNPLFLIKVGGVNFRVKESIFDSVRKEKMRVYYFSTPVKIILSAEILEN